MLRKSLPVAVIIGLAMAQSGCWEGTTRGVLATVLAVEGPAMVGPDVHGQFVPLLRGAHPGKGEIIETPGSSRAAISFLPNLLVQLEPKSRLEIIRIAITKDGNETGNAMLGRYANAKLMGGRMLASHAWGEATAKFTLITPHGELVTASNSLFWVDADEHKTRVTCVSGSVGFRPRDSDTVTRIAPGFVGEWSVLSSRVVAAASDARGQEELQEGLGVEQKLSALISQSLYALPR